MPTTTEPSYSVGTVLSVLHESHDMSAYEAAEKFVCTTEAPGFNADALLAMIDRGMALKRVLEPIPLKARYSQ